MNKLNYLSMIFPFGINSSLDKDILKLINHNLPTFDMIIGVQGISEAFSFYLTKNDKRNQISNNWQVSRYMNSIQSLAITLYLVCSVNK
jgi:hypothetical protein